MQPTVQHSLVEPFVKIGAKKRILLPIILTIALLLRLQQINQPYVDLAGWRESSMAMMADNFYHRNPNILFPEVSWNGPGESYNGREFQTVTYSANLLYRILGQHDWVGRLVAVCFGVWGVFALFQLARRVWDETHALLSAAVLAVLPSAIYFDRSFLPDPAMVSLVTTGLWFFMAYLQTGKRRYLLLTMLATGFGFLTKITGMLVLLPMLYAAVAILSIRKKQVIATFLKLLLAALVVLAVVAAYYLWARYLSLHYSPYHFAGEANWVWDAGLNTWLQQGYFLNKTGYIFSNWLLGKPFVGLFVAGIFVSFFYFKKQIPENNISVIAPYFFHFWLVGYLFFYSIGAQELTDNPWNFHIGDPMIAAFCSSPLILSWQLLKRQRALLYLTALAFLAWIIKSDIRVLHNTFTNKYYEADYQMGVQLRKLRQPGQLVAVLPKDVGNPISILYSNGRGWVFPPAGKDAWDRLPSTDATCIFLLEDLKKKGAVWFGVNQEQYQHLQTAYPQFATYLTLRFPLRVQQHDFVIFQLLP